MTKAKAMAIAKELGVKCDEPHIFVAQVGKGCLCDVDSGSDKFSLLTLLINLIEGVMNQLNRAERRGLREMLIKNLHRYLLEDAPIEKSEQLSGKQLKRRMNHNDRILTAVDERLKEEIK